MFLIFSSFYVLSIFRFFPAYKNVPMFFLMRVIFSKLWLSRNLRSCLILALLVPLSHGRSIANPCFMHVTPFSAGISQQCINFTGKHLLSSSMHAIFKPYTLICIQFHQVNHSFVYKVNFHFFYIFVTKLLSKLSVGTPSVAERWYTTNFFK